MIVIWIYLPKFRDPGDRDSDLVIKITRIKDTRDPDRKLIWTLEDKGCVKKSLSLCIFLCTLYIVRQGSSDSFYIVTYDIKWVTTSWKYSIRRHRTKFRSDISILYEET